MNRKISFVFLVSMLYALNLHAFEDSDLDGVEDVYDQCPNTPFMDIVDLDGCTKRSLLATQKKDSSPHHFDFIFGVSYSATDYNQLNRSDTSATSLQADYYYKNISLQASTSYFRSKESGGNTNSGFYDTFIGASYKIQTTKNLKFYLGAGILLPTYDTSLQNNNTDYKASISFNYYIHEKFNFFGGYSYTLINDDDVIITDANANSISYQYKNTNSFDGGIGLYATKNLYVSFSYFEGESIYKGYENIKSVSLYGYYTIDRNWFTTCSYARGLSDTATDNYASLRVGYYF